MALWKRLFGSAPKTYGPRTYGDYEAIEDVAKGRLSTLYRGRHVKTGEVAAIKVLSDYACRVADKLSRKLRKDWEGARQLKLEHRHVVRTIAAGKQHDRYYIVMEFLPGGNLAELLRANARSIQGRKMEIMRQAGRGLEYVHRQGIIHRDICPRNVMLSAYGHAKLIDFGVAAERGDRIRNTGRRTGRPLYMAPELIRTNRFNDQTDIYAFGVSLYEVATDQKPFSIADQAQKAFAVILNTAPKKPREIRPSISPGLETLILKAMAPKPLNRYKTMADLLADFDDLDDSDP